jgi:hypothetical protein
MAQVIEKKQETTTVFRTYERKDYGHVTSIDITPRFIKEFLQAQMYVDMGVMCSGDSEIDRRNIEVWQTKVKPFFDHMNEILDNL